MKKLFLLALIAATPSSAAWAADTSNGCGLGWHVTQSTTLSATTTRGTTNSTLPSTFSMTSGSSGCAKHAIAQRDVPAFQYVVVNYDSLTVEMAQGRGENLTAFARTMGCGDDTVALFGQMTQRRYSSIMSDGELTPIELFTHIKGQVAGDPVLSIACRS